MFVELLGGDSTSQSGVLVFFFLNKDLGFRKCSLANTLAMRFLFTYFICEVFWMIREKS